MGYKTLAILEGNPSGEERALDIAFRHGDAMLELGTRSTIVRHLSDAQARRRHCLAADERAREVGTTWARVIAEHTWAVALTATDRPEARRHHQRGWELAESIGWDEIALLNRVLLLDLDDSAKPQPLHLYRELLSGVITCGLEMLTPFILGRLGDELLAAGHREQSRAVLTLAHERWPSGEAVTGGYQPPAKPTPGIVGLSNELAVLRMLEELLDDGNSA